MLSPEEDCRPHEFFLRPPPAGDEAMARDDDSSPEPFPLPLPADVLATPIPPQELTSIVAELKYQIARWLVFAEDERVPEDVRNICYRCAESVGRILNERMPTDVSELAPESGR